MENIDYDRLREYLIDLIGPATMYNDAAQADLVYIEKCTDSELEAYAMSFGVDLSDFKRYER